MEAFDEMIFLFKATLKDFKIADMMWKRSLRI